MSSIRGIWSAGLVYLVGDVIEGPDGITYLSAFEHVANASFDVDLNLHRWLVIDSGVALDAALRTGLSTTAGAAMVGFTQSGSGAVARTLQDKLRDRSTVKDFGALGDAVTADEAKFTLCKNATGRLVVPAGEYLISDNYTIAVPIDFELGAKLKIAAGKTLTFANGYAIKAPLKQIFTGTGSVAGLWEAWPEWFGAAHDDATDDTAAILKAGASLATGLATGGVLRLAPETYLWDGTQQLVLAAYQGMTGEGIHKSVFRVTGTGGKLIKLGAGSHATGFSTVRATAQATSGAAIDVIGPNSGLPYTLRDISLAGAYNGISLLDLSQATIENYTATDTKNSCLLQENTGDVFLHNFLFTTGDAANHAAGAIKLMNHVEAFVADTGDILGGSYAMVCDAVSNTLSNRPAYNKFTNVYFDSATNGVNLIVLVATTFTNCWFSNRPFSGCVVRDGCADVTFSTTHFINCGAYGCYCEDGARRMKWLGCSFISNSSTLANTYHGLAIEPNMTDFVIQGCTASNTLGFGGTQGYGIVVNAGTSDRYIIADNLVTGNGIAGVSDGGSGANKRVANNY